LAALRTPAGSHGEGCSDGRLRGDGPILDPRPHPSRELARFEGNILRTPALQGELHAEDSERRQKRHVLAVAPRSAANDFVTSTSLPPVPTVRSKPAQFGMSVAHTLPALLLWMKCLTMSDAYPPTDPLDGRPVCQPEFSPIGTPEGAA
jgi:hypothetical protein